MNEEEMKDELQKESEFEARAARRKDLTTGTVWKKLIWFFLPIALGTWIQQLYNTVDGLVLSKFVGTEALASAGGSSANIINLMIGVFVAVTAGASVVIAQLYGAGKDKDVRKALGNAFCVSVVAGIVLGTIGFILTPWLLKIYKAPAEIIPTSTTYLRIIFIGVPFVLTLNMESNTLRSCGDSRSPFIFMLASCINNIVLDLLFVAVFKWGIAGAAIATVVSQVLNFTLLTIKFCTTDKPYKFKLKHFKLKGKFLGSMLKLGIPSGAESLMYAISNSIIQVAVNALGTIGVAAWTLTDKIDGIFWATSSALGVAVTAFIGQNIGAKKDDRVKKCVKQGTFIGLILTISLSAIIMLIARPLLPLFTDDVAVQGLTFEIMSYFVPLYFTWTMVGLLSAVLRGAGDAVRPVIILGLCICLFRVVWIYTVHAYFNTVASLCLVYGASWAFTTIVMVLYYKFSNWRERAGKVVEKAVSKKEKILELSDSNELEEEK